MTPAGVGVGDHTRQVLLNIQTVLEEAGSSLQNMIKATVFLTDMQNFAAMNKVWVEMVQDPKPARTCVAVRELPFGTDVSVFRVLQWGWEGMRSEGEVVAGWVME
jgi:2-iminobutanoate/2-iminopropanoate deaminase